MWRLTTSEGGGPWLRSANGFLGRQVWEYDPDTGTSDERAEVDRLRADYTKHRFHRKESQDLLLRLQVHVLFFWLDHFLFVSTHFGGNIIYYLLYLTPAPALLQYAKLNPLPVNIPTLKLDKSAELTEEILSTSLRRALNRFSTLQADDGHWPGVYSGLLFIMPIIVSIHLSHDKDAGFFYV
jgi:achilleol B synthase